MANKKKAYICLAALAVLTAAVIAAAALWPKNGGPEYVGYNEFITMTESGTVAGVTLTDGSRFTFTTADGASFETDNPRNSQFKETLLLQGISVAEGNGGGDIVSTVGSLLFFVMAAFLVLRLMNRQSGSAVMAMDFKEAAETVKARVAFDDIAGSDEAKESVLDIVDFIKNPGKYAGYGARMPRGVIFYGPPGTGKTLMAKAIAGEAGAPFFAVSGSDFVQMYVGVGASRIRALFKKAREAGKAVIFIDEIDALAKKRGGYPSSGGDERDQTLNALLTEMSGFLPNDGVVVIAATNRLDTLDEALLRPGRFDRQVELGLPDLASRERILHLHGKNKPLAGDVDMASLARQTVFFSGAMLENLMNEAAIAAARKGSGVITEGELDEAYYTIVAGKAKKDRSGVMEQERKVTAFHEAGHALAAKLKCPDNTVSKITIIPSVRGAGGFCLNIPPDKLFYTKTELENQIMVSLAGRASEELTFGQENITTGASADLTQASALIRDMVVKYGMGQDAGLTPLSETDTLRECGVLAERLYNDVKSFLISRQSALKRVANALLLKETLNESELTAIINASDSE